MTERRLTPFALALALMAAGQAEAQGQTAVAPPREVAPGATVPAVPRVDADTGRPVDRAITSVDIVDNAASNRARRDADVPVLSYIPLPTVAVDPMLQPQPRARDRGFLARVLPGQTVKQMPRPEYQAQGFRAGGFRMLPYLSVGLLGDSNVYADNDARADLIATGSAGVDVRSDWGRHLLDLSAVVRQRQYFRFDSETTATYRIAGTGRYDLSSNAAIVANAYNELAMQDRSAVEEVFSQGLPLVLRTTGGDIAAQIDRGLWQFDLGGMFAHSGYRDNLTVTGAFVEQSFRDNDKYGVHLNIGREIGGQRVLYSETSYSRVRFAFDPTIVNRDVDVIRAVGGLRGGITRLIRGHLGIGYINIDFSDPGFRDLGAPIIDGQLDWLVTKRTTVTFQGMRDLRTAAQIDSRGMLVTKLQLGVDHEARRNLILSASVDRQWSDYIRDPRRARSTGGSIGATLLINRTMQWHSQIAYRKRTDRGFNINASPEDFTGGMELTLRF